MNWIIFVVSSNMKSTLKQTSVPMRMIDISCVTCFVKIVKIIKFKLNVTG